MCVYKSHVKLNIFIEHKVKYIYMLKAFIKAGPVRIGKSEN